MISKNFTKYFQIPLYWLILLVFFFLVSSSLMSVIISEYSLRLPDGHLIIIEYL